MPSSLSRLLSFPLETGLFRFSIFTVKLILQRII
ncbi:hypothetical protein LINPERHAP2_LOCUS24359 [Linum perenne]